MSRVTAWMCAAAVFLIAGQAAWGAQLGFIRYTPAFYFTDADWEMATADFDAFLSTQEDGAEFGGSNPDTGSAWRFRALGSVEEDGQPCRQVEITLEARKAESVPTNNYLFCRDADADWRMVRGLP